MSIFSKKTRKKIVGELRQRSQYYSNDLTKEISESLEELKSDYKEIQDVLPEFDGFVADLKTRLNPEDAARLQEFVSRFSRVDRSARKGVDALWDLSKNTRKIAAENLRELEEMEHH